METDKGTLRIIGPNSITELRVVDGSLHEVASGIHHLTVELDPEIYLVQASLFNERTEQLVIVEPGKTSLLDNLSLKYVSAIPLQSDNSRKRDAAERESKNPHATMRNLSLKKGALGRLFIFASTLGERDDRQLSPTFTLRSEQEQLAEITFPESGILNSDEGWLALTVDVPSGIYTIEQEVPGLGKRSQVLFVEQDWETQVFVPWYDIPNFAQATLFMCEYGRGFDPNYATDYEQTEAILRGLAKKQLILTKEERENLFQGKVQNPLIALAVSYFLLQQAKTVKDFEVLQRIVQELWFLLPHCLDVRFLSYYANKGNTFISDHYLGNARFSQPPLFASGTEFLICESAKHDWLCPANSWLAKISMSLTTGSIWTRWEADVKEAQALERLIKTLQRLHEEMPSSSAADFAQILQLPFSLIVKVTTELGILTFTEQQVSREQKVKYDQSELESISSRVTDVRSSAKQRKKVFQRKAAKLNLRQRMVAILASKGKTRGQNAYVTTKPIELSRLPSPVE